MSLVLLLAGALSVQAAQVALLVCPDARTCAEDRAWVEEIGGSGPAELETIDVDPTAAAPVEGAGAKEAFDGALDALREAVDRGRWGAASESARAAEAALARWSGPVRTQALFDLYLLQGIAAAEQGRDDAQAYAFRQAAAVQGDQRLPTPVLSTTAERAWLDEQRKLQVGGQGELLLDGGPSGTDWTVDGRRVAPGAPIAMWPGNHRVSATAPGHLRAWTASVPVLAARESRVQPDFGRHDQAAWVQGALHDAVSTLDAPEEVEELLVAWADAHQASEIRLLRVDEATRAPRVAKVQISAAPDDRPDAASGERGDMGDGIPVTYEAEVADRYAAPGEAHLTRLKRLRVVFFDPATRRFSAEPRVSTALVAPPPRIYVGAAAGYTGMLERSHLGGQAVVQVPLTALLSGELSADLRLGMVRGSAPYNLYREWSDRGLYHAVLGARWAGPWTVAPTVGLGAEVYAPVAVGGRLALGAQADLGHHWRLLAEAHGGLLDQGLSAGGTVGLVRGF